MQKVVGSTSGLWGGIVKKPRCTNVTRDESMTVQSTSDLDKWERCGSSIHPVVALMSVPVPHFFVARRASWTNTANTLCTEDKTILGPSALQLPR